MKKMLAIVLALSMVWILTACHSADNSGTAYSAHIKCDTFYNIAAISSVLHSSPVVASDDDNLGAVYIRVLNDKGEIICDSILVAPGEMIALSEIPAFGGTCTIQGKAAEANGEYTFTVN